MKLTPEQELGSYRLVSRIGAGGMGEVWRAVDLKLRRTVAIKILLPSSGISEEAQARLLREARTAAQLNHPNIATIHSIEQHDELSFIVMEFVDGEPLTRKIKNGPMPEAEVLSIARQIAEALAEAHSRGIVHRDIKPDNIMLAGARLKVLDFGIAKQTGVVAETSEKLSDYVTAAGIVLGTIYYMSPEQALGRPLDPRTDLFSLGVVMYQALSRELPFVGQTMTDTMTRIIRDEAPPLRARNPSISDAAENIVERCLQKEPNYRYENAHELIEAIDRARPAATIQSLDSVSFAPVTVPMDAERDEEEPGGRRRWGVIPALAGVAIVAISLFVFLRDSVVSEPAPATIASAMEPAIGEPPPPSSPVEAGPDEVASPGDAVTSTISPPAEPTEGTTQIAVEKAKPELQEEAFVDVSAPQGATAEEIYKQGLLLVANRPVAALMAFRAALAKDSEHAPARVKAGQLLLRTNRAEAAIQFRSALENRDRLDDRQAGVASLGLAMAEGDVTLARERAKAFAARYPNDPDLRWLMKEAERMMSATDDERPSRATPRRRVRG